MWVYLSVFSRVHLGHFIYAACWPGICHSWRGGHQKHFTSAGPPEFEWLSWLEKYLT